jgi:hypothetical protein
MEDWTNGKTCIDCQYCVEVRKHPWNNLVHSKGGMKDHMGFACLLFREDNNVAIFMDHADGFCECFTEKNGGV